MSSLRITLLSPNSPIKKQVFTTTTAVFEIGQLGKNECRIGLHTHQSAAFQLIGPFILGSNVWN